MRAYKAKWIITAEGNPLEDHYLIVEDGKVTAVGTHAELSQSCEAYKTMVELQRLEANKEGM